MFVNNKQCLTYIVLCMWWLVFSANWLWYMNQKTFQQLLCKKGGRRATWEYPFAVAGVNVTFMLIQMLELRCGMNIQNPFVFPFTMDDDPNWLLIFLMFIDKPRSWAGSSFRKILAGMYIKEAFNKNVKSEIPSIFIVSQNALNFSLFSIWAIIWSVVSILSLSRWPRVFGKIMKIQVHSG